MAVVGKYMDELNMLLLSAIHLNDVSSLENCLLTVNNPNTYLNQIHEELEDQKCTLLMLACLNEHEDMMCMLLNSFQPDIEVLNDIKINIKDQTLKTYTNVTVLWAAAALNNFKLVKLIVEHGARVNHTTGTNSTALRCSCFHGNLTMTRYLIEHGADVRITKERHETNLMLSVFREHVQLVSYLVAELECDVNECDDENCSPLYLAVDRGSVEIVTFLISHGARNFPTTYNQMSPLMLAAEKRNNDLIEIIVPYCLLLERIQAEELLGSAFACSEHGACELDKSYEHFSRAIELRLTYHLPKLLKESTHEVFNHRQECQTIDQLQELQSNPYNMYIEALLIRERLLGPSSVKYRNSLLHRGASLATTVQYQQGIAFWMYELELNRQWSLPIFSKQLRYFVKTFADIVHRSLPLSIQNLYTVTSIILDELERNTIEFDYNLYTLLFLITVFSEILTQTLNINTDQKMFYRLVYSINQHRFVSRDDGSSLLHLSLSGRTMTSDASINRIFRYPCLHTARTLVQCGADVNAPNAVRNTPLHVFVSNSRGYDESILQLLCNANAHMDYVNALNETPMDTASDMNIKKLLKARTKLSLKCLCARLIQKNDIPFHDHIGHSLASFVKQH